jgi:4-amino-4-deoxy-L-arabinose transferase-like glycosyltransferase
LKLSKNYQVLILFCIGSVLIRFLTFFPSVINHDESTYLVIAQELLKGKLLYVDTIDVKPPGIFLIMVLLRLLFGNSVFMIRLITSLVIGFTSYLIFKVKLNNGGNRKAAMAAGFIYIFMLSVFTFYGVSVNTETYLNLFTISGLLFLLRKKKLLNFLVAGLLLGCGFIIKYVVLFDLMAFILFLMIISRQEARILALKPYLNYVVLIVSFMIPFGLINLYYYLIGHYDEFLFHSFEVSRNYPVERNAAGVIKYILDFHVRFLPVIFFFYYCLFDKSIKTKNIKTEKLLVAIWVIFDLVVILYPGKYFGHYFIQLILPVSFFAGNFLDPERKLPAVLKKVVTKPIGYILIIILVLVIIFTQKKDYIDKPDYPRQISKYLAAQLNENDIIYTGNYHHIIYFLLDKGSPTRYVHRTLIRAKHHVESLKINTYDEIERIINADPAYIINKGKSGFTELQEFIDQNYILIKTFDKDIYIYRRAEIL